MGGNFSRLTAFSQEHGFGLIQLNLDNPSHFPEIYSPADRADIRKQSHDLGIGLCFHGPSDIPLMNRHERIRQAGLERVFEMIDLAVDMGGEYFIFHPGRLAFYSQSSNKIIFMERRYPERIGGLFADSLNRLLAHCDGRIELCIENTHAIPAPFLDIIGDLVSRDGLGLVWDAGHTEQLTGSRRTQMVQFFQTHIKNVKLAHLHDIRGGVAHKALGSGTLNISGYLEIFNALSLDVILEIFPEEELVRSVKYLRKLVVIDKLS
jgi:sugar phosphate isomerase/epimerase